MNRDTRYCYGASCTWCGPIEEVGSTEKHPRWAHNRVGKPDRLSASDYGLPCCPHCGGMLFEMQSAKQWWKGVDDFAAGRYENGKPHPYYADMWRWQRTQKTCFAKIEALRDAYEVKTGFHVDLER